LALRCRGDEAATLATHRIALLAVVNLLRRTLLGGVEAIGVPDTPLLIRRGPACGGNCDCNSLKNGRTAAASAGRYRNYRRGTEDAAFLARSKARLMMKYRDVEYTVVQGIERGLWKWSASAPSVT